VNRVKAALKSIKAVASQIILQSISAHRIYAKARKPF
jgi:hypothetical protein